MEIGFYRKDWLASYAYKLPMPLLDEAPVVVDVPLPLPDKFFIPQILPVTSGSIAESTSAEMEGIVESVFQLVSFPRRCYVQLSGPRLENKN